VTSADPPPDVASYVTGDMFRARLESAIIKAVAFGAISLPQIPVDYLHGILAFVDARGIASVAVDGALLLGFSSSSDGQTGALSGHVTALTDFAGSFDLAAFVNPLAAPLFFSDVQDSLAKAATSAGDTLDTSALSIVLADGHAHVTGKIDATGATLNFSFDVIPNMANYSGPGGEWVAYTREHWVDDPHPRTVKPRSWPALWFTTGNAQSDVDGSWWVDVLDVLTLGYLLLYFLPKFSNAESSFDNQINDHPPNAPYPRVQRIAAPAGGIVLRTALDSFELNSDGISVGVHVSVKPTTIAVTGPAIIPSNYDTDLLHYTLRLPSGVLPTDPTLRVAWTPVGCVIRRGASQSGQSGDRTVTGVRVQAWFVRLEHGVRDPRPLVPALRHGFRRRRHSDDVTTGARGTCAKRLRELARAIGQAASGLRHDQRAMGIWRGRARTANVEVASHGCPVPGREQGRQLRGTIPTEVREHAILPAQRARPVPAAPMRLLLLRRTNRYEREILMGCQAAIAGACGFIVPRSVSGK
jgi:hypothetical protein